MFIKKGGNRIEKATISSELPDEIPEKLSKCAKCGKPFIPTCSTPGECVIYCPKCLQSN